MRLNVQKADVIIVGAGLPGLVMAYQLLRFGIQPVIIDSRSSPSDKSQIIMLQASTMELFRQMGIDQEINMNAVDCGGVTVHNQSDDDVRTHYFHDPNTPFPFLTIIAQDAVEHLLIKQLTSKACPIYWNTSLVDQKQGPNDIEMTFNSQGIISQCKVKWVIAADGARSRVRKLSRLSFDGTTYKQRFFVADVWLDSEKYNDLHLFLTSSVLFSMFPIPHGGHYRLIGYLPQDRSDSEHTIRLFKEQVSSLVPLKGYTHIKSYFIQSRIVSAFNDHHCFFIGNAAQVHSPLAGLGVNTGIQDAYNLSWKLANVLKEKQHIIILNSYGDERQQLANSIFKRADRIFGVLTHSPGIFQGMVNRFMHGVFHLLFENVNARNFLLSGFYQTAITYRTSPLSVHHSSSKKIKAGDKVPYLSVFDERTKTETDLHRWCNKPGFTLILMGKISSNQLLIMAKWLRQKYTHYMHIYYLPFSDRNQSVFETFQMQKEAHKMILIRPDMHIAYIQDVISADLIDNYMTEIMRWKF